MTRHLSLVEGKPTNFRIVPWTEAATILIFDISNIGHKAWSIEHFRKMTFKDKPSGHVFGSFRNIFAFLRRSRQPLAIFYALDGYPKARYEAYPSYKGNRDRDGRGDPLPDVTALSWLLPGSSILMPEWEADDAIASVVDHIRNAERKSTSPTIRDIYIISGDRDLWQLVDIHTFWWERSSEKPENLDTLEAQGYRPDEVRLRKILFGDQSDHIKGVPRIPKIEVEPFIVKSRGDVNLFLRMIRDTAKKPLCQIIKKNLPIIHRNNGLVILHVEPINIIPNDTSKKSLIRFLVKKFGCESLQADAERLFPE